ncbi:Uncharacterized protein Fot_03822 [Forsythia ovata]|uniref:Uncharacterized protein n=1 Tax=Forsythia ovata TaxID=205694 RepID=A0ABD1XDV5_9LAMI
MATRLEGTDVSHTDFSASNVASGSQTSATKTHLLPSKWVVINERSARPSSQPTLKEVVGKEKALAEMPMEKASTRPPTLARFDDSTSLSQRKELLKLMQPSFRGRNGKLLPRAPN